MRVLAIGSASGGCAAAIVQDGTVLAEAKLAAERGLPAEIPPMVAALIAEAGMPDLVAVVVGPGSFTGLRAGISVAQGVGLGAGVKVVGVTVAEALADALPQLGGRELWVATDSRRGRIFLERDGVLESVALDALPTPNGRVAVAGDAAIAVTGALAARGADVMLTSAKRPTPRHVAIVGARRAEGALPALEPIPLYVDGPEAKLPAGGLRPAPIA
jgi:tRNA threonylcarbamoyl adenosine modification protein YeaZ